MNSSRTHLLEPVRPRQRPIEPPAGFGLRQRSLRSRRFALGWTGRTTTGRGRRQSGEFVALRHRSPKRRRARLAAVVLIVFLVFCSMSPCFGAERASVAAPNSATNTPAGPATKDSVVFRNGDLLYGSLQSIEADGSVRWQHPDALEPIEFIPGTISEIKFGNRPPPPFNATNGCQVRLTNQDELEGNLVLCDTQKVVLDTWFAGKIEVPRPRVQFITPSPLARPPVFEGPTGVEGWTHGKVVSAVPNSGVWKYKDGALYASQSASIARDLKLPDTANVQFDLTWKGLLYIAIALYTDYLHPINLNSRESEPDFGGFYSLQLYNYAADLLPVDKTNALRRLGQVPIPTIIQKNKIHIEIRANKSKRTIALLVDGSLVKQWIDTEGFVGTGTGMRFVHQGQGAVKLSNLRITEWDGQFEEKPSNPPESKVDLAKLLNGDKVTGDLQTIRDGKMTFTVAGGNSLDIPMERVKMVEMAGQKAIRAPEDPADIQAVFRRGGSVTLRLEKWTAQEVIGVNPNFGRVVFSPLAFERVQFSLPPSPKPAAQADGPNIPRGRAVVRAVRGSADYREAASEWKKLRVGQALPVGSVIRTAPDSIVDLYLGANRGVIRLRAETILALTALDLHPSNPEPAFETRLKLEKGRILAKPPEPRAGSKWEVHSARGIVVPRNGEFAAAEEPGRDE